MLIESLGSERLIGGCLILRGLRLFIRSLKICGIFSLGLLDIFLGVGGWRNPLIYFAGWGFKPSFWHSKRRGLGLLFTLKFHLYMLSGPCPHLLPLSYVWSLQVWFLQRISLSSFREGGRGWWWWWEGWLGKAYGSNLFIYKLFFEFVLSSYYKYNSVWCWHCHLCRTQPMDELESGLLEEFWKKKIT